MTKPIRLLLVLLLLVAPSAYAGVFDLPAFLNSGEWSVGLEPEISISDGTGAAVNLKPRWGLNDLINLEGVMGVGGGRRKNRLGMHANFEWFPDYERQPGIASDFFMEYYDLEDGGMLMVGVRPLIYKTFQGQQAAYTPFFSIPFGWNIRSGNVEGFMQVALGSMFKLPEQDKWRFTLEAGFNAKNAYSYLSGGVTYFF